MELVAWRRVIVELRGQYWMIWLVGYWEVWCFFSKGFRKVKILKGSVIDIFKFYKFQFFIQTGVFRKYYFGLYGVCFLSVKKLWVWVLYILFYQFFQMVGQLSFEFFLGFVFLKSRRRFFFQIGLVLYQGIQFGTQSTSWGLVFI